MTDRLADAIAGRPDEALRRVRLLHGLRPKLSRLTTDQLAAIGRIVDQLLDAGHPAVAASGSRGSPDAGPSFRRQSAPRPPESRHDR